MITAYGVKGFHCEVHVGRYSLDVADSVRKLCLEVDGEFWHAINLTDYAKRDKLLRARGWRVKRVGTSRKELQKALAWVLVHVT